MANNIVNVLSDYIYGVDKRDHCFVAMVTDNGRNYESARDLLVSGSVKGPDDETSQPRYAAACISHSLQLVVKADSLVAVPYTSELIKRVRELVDCLKSASLWRLLLQSESVAGRTGTLAQPKMDCDTRWNTIFAMFKSLIPLKTAIMTLVSIIRQAMAKLQQKRLTARLKRDEQRAKQQQEAEKALEEEKQRQLIARTRFGTEKLIREAEQERQQKNEQKQAKRVATLAAKRAQQLANEAASSSDAAALGSNSYLPSSSASTSSSSTSKSPSSTSKSSTAMVRISTNSTTTSSPAAVTVRNPDSVEDINTSAWKFLEQNEKLAQRFVSSSLSVVGWHAVGELIALLTRPAAITTLAEKSVGVLGIAYFELLKWAHELNDEMHTSIGSPSSSGSPVLTSSYFRTDDGSDSDSEVRNAENAVKQCRLNMLSCVRTRFRLDKLLEQAELALLLTPAVARSFVDFDLLDISVEDVKGQNDLDAMWRKLANFTKEIAVVVHGPEERIDKEPSEAGPADLDASSTGMSEKEIATLEKIQQAKARIPRPSAAEASVSPKDSSRSREKQVTICLI